MPIVSYLEAPDIETLKLILTKPRNSLTKQYAKLLEMDGVELTFDDDAIVAIAEKAQKRKMGARALRSIIESVMKDLMFEVPSSKTIKEIVVTGQMVEKINLAEVIPIETNKKEVKRSSAKLQAKPKTA